MIETVDVVQELAVILSLSPVAVYLSPVLDFEDLVLLLVSAEVAIKDEDYCFEKYHILVQFLLAVQFSLVAVHLYCVAPVLFSLAVHLFFLQLH